MRSRPESETPRLTESDRTQAMLCHVAAFAAVVFPLPFASVLGPLIAWLIVRENSKFADEHGREALNFQLTVAMVGATLLLVAFVLIWDRFVPIIETGTASTGEIQGLLGAILLPGLGLAVLALYDVIATAVAAIRAYSGQSFRYPATIRFL